MEAKSLEGEVLEETQEVPPVRDVTPGWIGRNRTVIEKGRNVTRALIMVAPPPVRIPLAVASLAADAALLADDMRRRGEDPKQGSLRVGALALEGAAVLAVTRFAPARLAANLGGIEAARRAVDRVLERSRA